MVQQTEQLSSGDSKMLSMHKQVGKICLLTSGFALLGIALLLLWMLYNLPQGYQALGVELLEAQRNLPWLMSLTALILVLGAGVTTWLIGLYSSFRVAGPLYRFARNLEIKYRHSNEPILSIRRGDALQNESDALMETIERLQRHQDALMDDVSELQKQLRQSGGEDLLQPVIDQFVSQIDPIKV
ncbi:hypothetical protein [Aestuariirhabdus litorea]|uniref:HAMP domain-containing protein n=1 Tax=Aestuariirhabdus litorea TaxID=2528527 RepID=A0A3P3VX37_9GAMM|nr:hypothetical protein [Aestuariirhabdus litorea]RRJ85263.1 hypothetical protein D0544_09430 [Aestuariirhabdus litorea]RWW98485.1 hypothetical protein DZC74_09415 [Endozoicomonadaceae bacterium GTF-13]